MERRRALLAELRSYVGLTDEDARLLAQLRSHAEPHFRAIADEFYAVIRLHEGALLVLKDEAQAQRLHASLQVWLRDLLDGPYDVDWAERQARVGQVHVKVGLELRYMVSAMSRIRVSLQRVAADSLGEAAGSTRLAIARICDLALAVMLESYKDDLVARIDRTREREQQDIQLRLDERERLFRDVIEAADLVVLGFDPDRRLVIANAKAERLTGYARDELLAGDVFQLLFGVRGPQMRQAWLEGGPARSGAAIECETLTRSGRSRLVRWYLSEHEVGSRDDVPSVVVLGLDVTHERELERRARQNERLAAAGALAAGLAHEIRNPLNGASLHLSVLDRALGRAPAASEEAREAVAVLRAEIRRLGALVTDFLDVARPKPLSRADSDMNEVARAVHTLLAPEAASRNVSFRLEPFAFPAQASFDGERMKQVLVNLVRNALEAVQPGGTVTMRVRRLPRDVELDIVDDGPGIADPNAPIFDAFYTTKDRGTGLGLSIVQRIVTDHGGEVGFTSQPGATVFTVRLPVSAAGE